MNKYYVYFVGGVAALAGLLFGVDLGVVAGIQPYLRAEWGLNTHQIEFAISSILIGAVVGAILSGFLNRIFGRKPILAASALIFVIGSLGSAFVNSYETLIILRVFLGLALGSATFTAPLYISEVAPKETRGLLISTYQLMITIGIVIAYMSDMYFVHLQASDIITKSETWRWMLGVVAIPSLIMFLIVFALPRSPRWVMMKGDKNKALSILKRLHSDKFADTEIKEIESSLSHSGNIFERLSDKRFLSVLSLGIGLQLIQQFSGMNAILYYAPAMFVSAGFDNVNAMGITVLIGIVNVISTLIALALIDKLGRKKLLYIGGFILLISTVVLSLLFKKNMTATESIVSILFIFLFIFGFAISYGPVIWTLCAEIFPLRGRELGITFSTASNWIGNTLIASYSLSIMNSIGTNMFYLLLAAFAVISLLVFKFFVPETKGVSLEHIEQNLWSDKALNKIGV